MEWLVGIERWRSDLVGQVESEAGTEMVALELLGKRGLPKIAAQSRLRAQLHLNQMRLADASATLHELGVSPGAGADNQHDIYEFEQKGKKVFVPALLLMRELFGPPQFLLPEMFRPQALDRVSRLVQHPTGIELVVDARWLQLARQRRLRDCTAPLRWMRTHPSAFCMASSVHLNALAGRVSLALPAALASLSLRVLRVQEGFFATSLAMNWIEPLENPMFLVPGLEARVILRDVAEPASASAWQVREHDIPRRGDGDTDLTEAEWALVREILVANHAQSCRRTHCPRLVLNGVLRKLSSGKGWASTHYEAGDWRNASQAYRDWKRRGVFDELLKVLQRTRGSEMGIER